MFVQPLQARFSNHLRGARRFHPKKALFVPIRGGVSLSNAATEIPIEAKISGLDESLPLLLETPLRLGSSGTGIAERFERVLTWVEVILDIITAAGAVLIAYFINSSWLTVPHRTLPQVAVIAAAFGVFCALMLDRDGAYRSGNSLLRVRETERVLRFCAQSYVVALALIRFGEWPLSFRALSLAAILVCTALLGQKHLVYTIVRQMHARGLGLQRVVIIGAGYTGRRVYSALARSPKLGLKPIAVFDENPVLAGTRVYESSYNREGWLPVNLASFRDVDLRPFSECMMVVAIPSLPREKFVHLLNSASAANMKFAFVPNHHVPTDLWTEHADIDGLLLESFARPPRRALYEVSKRLFDIVVSLAILLMAIPVWLTIVAFIRIESEGRALFKQKRVGKDGHLFDCYKFRSMYRTTPAYGMSPKNSTDPRITRVGRFLRRTSLDEMPQLLNVLRGDMSLVGPRPEMPFLVDRYLLLHRNRLQVKPGITGLWQISADRGSHIHENTEYDLYYIQNRSFFVDLAIVLHTILFAMRGI